MSTTMEAPLSTYWVRFFKAAGFSPDVATRHAVVFSNNRIQPDMLPDLDKPSLKEMGITLMGDMIAILRYAKKVVEETTCERFLVDSKDLVPSKNSQPTTSEPIKKVSTKVAPKTIIVSKSQSPVIAKKVASKAVTVKKKSIPMRTISQAPEKLKTQVMKRKLAMDKVNIKTNLDYDEDDDDNEDNYVKQKSNKRAKLTDDKVGYKVIMPKGTTERSQSILKKAVEQKRTVFDRLGDSSVTSTTTSTESNPTFNVTGLGKTIFKRTLTNNVFKRLGDKDLKKEDKPYVGILKNGSTSLSHGVLKSNRNSSNVSTTIPVKKVITKPVGTMHADYERKKRQVISTGTKQMVTSSKMASERIKSIPAKQRLGTSKQVTFNKVATVAHVKKQGVFSRLGI